MNENRDKISLERIFESIKIIEFHLAGFEYNNFETDQKTYDAVLMQTVNIGEMINGLSDGFKEKYHALPWHEAVGMRNQIAHGYFEINKKIVWKTAKDDLPELKKQINDILKNI